MIEIPSGTNQVKQTVCIIDERNTIIGGNPIESSYGSIAVDSKVFDGALYRISANNDALKVQSMNINSLPTVKLDCLEYSNIPKAKQAPESSPNGNAVAKSISRSEVIRIAGSYHADFTWSCTDANLKPMTNWTCPHYVNGPGNYSFMPYCWGGFSSQSQFKTGLSNGGRVGNIDCDSSGHVSNTYGLDCSGFVSRCWGQTSKYGTSTIGGISSNLSSYSELKRGDALLLAGSHIMLFDHFDTSSGDCIVYESTLYSDFDRVSYTVRPMSYLSSNGYVAIRYDGIVD